nr:hypothetical protein [Clostridium perfringens]
MYVRGEIVNFKDIQSLKARHSKEEFENILLTVEQDLKFNYIRFKKPIPKKKFIEVLNITESLFRRII